MKKKYLIFIFVLFVLSLIFVNAVPQFFKKKNEYSEYSLLVIDINKDGKTNKVIPQQKRVYFDYNGNDVANNTIWIENDYILVYDKNHDTEITYGKEFFYDKELTKLQILKQLDSNNDNIIDRFDKEHRYIKFFNDKNTNGKINSDEIIGFTDMTIYLDKNKLEFDNKIYNFDEVHLQASKVQTTYAHKDKLMNTVFYNNSGLPLIRGYGNVFDTFIVYRLSKPFTAYTLNFKEEHPKYIEDNFESFISRWTGLYEMHNKYGIKREKLNYDDKAWILDKISGNDFNVKEIEAAYSNRQEPKIKYNKSYIDVFYVNGVNQALARFLIQTKYKNYIKGAYYSINTDSMKVLNQDYVNTSILERIEKLQDEDELKRFAKTLAYLNHKEKFFKSSILKNTNNIFLDTYNRFMLAIKKSKEYADEHK